MYHKSKVSLAVLLDCGYGEGVLLTCDACMSTIQQQLITIIPFISISNAGNALKTHITAPGVNEMLQCQHLMYNILIEVFGEDRFCLLFWVSGPQGSEWVGDK